MSSTVFLLHLLNSCLFTGVIQSLGCQKRLNGSTPSRGVQLISYFLINDCHKLITCKRQEAGAKSELQMTAEKDKIRREGRRTKAGGEKKTATGRRAPSSASIKLSRFPMFNVLRRLYCITKEDASPFHVSFSALCQTPARRGDGGGEEGGGGVAETARKSERRRRADKK